jgi:protein-S-isoprenylcysteine O-methyltransferase Ste14
MVFWLAGLAVAWAVKAPAVDLARPSLASSSSWILALAGVGMRIWAAANLEKNRFASPSGPYLLMRHPLYAGTITVSLGFFISLGIPATGILLWAGMIGAVFLPVIRKEERELSGWFPRDYPAYARRVPRLLPDPRTLPAAVRTSRSSLVRARRNFGLRALWLVPAVLGLNQLLEWLLRSR